MKKRLPDYYLITPDPTTMDQKTFLATLEKSLQVGIRLTQLRAKNLPLIAYLPLAKQHGATGIASISNLWGKLI